MDAAKPQKNRKRMPYERKKRLYGYGFISFWLFGLVFYFFRPLSETLRFSLGRIYITDNGYGVFWQGLSNYRYILLEDPDFIQAFWSSLSRLLYEIPVLLVFVVVIATILNQKFIGKTAMRAVFFIPVIVASGVIISIFRGDSLAVSIISGSYSSSMMQAGRFEGFFYQLGLPAQIINPVVTAFRNIFDISWRSGIQILIMLAGLQTIPSALYEASSIEGASGWDNFWLITFPMVTPMFVLVVIYSLIDSFINVDAWLMSLIRRKSLSGQIELGATMSLLYSLGILAVVGILYLIINRIAKKNVDV